MNLFFLFPFSLRGHQRSRAGIHQTAWLDRCMHKCFDSGLVANVRLTWVSWFVLYCQFTCSDYGGEFVDDRGCHDTKVLILFYFFPTVDKNKSKAGSHQQRPQQQASQQKQSNRPQDAVPASLTEVDRINQNVQQLKGLLRASNCRFEALSIVLQQTLTGVRIDLFHRNTFICSLKYILWLTFG